MKIYTRNSTLHVSGYIATLTVRMCHSIKMVVLFSHQ